MHALCYQLDFSTPSKLFGKSFSTVLSTHLWLSKMLLGWPWNHVPTENSWEHCGMFSNNLKMISRTFHHVLKNSQWEHGSKTNPRALWIAMVLPSMVLKPPCKNILLEERYWANCKLDHESIPPLDTKIITSTASSISSLQQNIFAWVLQHHWG